MNLHSSAMKPLTQSAIPPGFCLYKLGTIVPSSSPPEKWIPDPFHRFTHDIMTDITTTTLHYTQSNKTSFFHLFKRLFIPNFVLQHILPSRCHTPRPPANPTLHQTSSISKMPKVPFLSSSNSRVLIHAHSKGPRRIKRTSSKRTLSTR
jgi:hypothetical protein